MRKDVENFLNQAESDLRNAKLLFDNKAYDLVAFLSHQIAEKAMKAYNLKELADVADVPIKIGKRNALKEFISAVNKRYPLSFAVLFGSRARGDALKSSDYDIWY